MNEVRIPYRPNTTIFFLAISFFAICATVFAHIGINNDRGLILNGIIKFSPEGATVFYWCFFALSLCFVVVGSVALITSLILKKEIIITSTTISSPKNGFSRKNVNLNFSEITGFEVQTIQKTRILTFYHPEGKLSIPNSMVPTKKHFDNLVSLMEGRDLRYSKQ